MGGEWERFRTINTRCNVALLCGFLLFVPCVMLADRVFGLPSLGIVPSLICLALASWYWTQAVGFPCPRCGRDFFYRASGWNPLHARSCLHCQLRKWEDPPVTIEATHDSGSVP